MKPVLIIIQTLAALTLLLSCSQESPVQNTGQTQDTIVIQPVETGTIRWFPEMDSLGLPPYGDDVQVSYFRTTPTNREIRRGFAEFAVPTINDTLVSVGLLFKDNHAWVSDPRPPDDYVISFYAADSVLDTLDFKRAAFIIDTIQVDANETQKSYCLDITGKITPYCGQRLGIRFALNQDSLITDSLPRGALFGWASEQPTIRIITR